MPGTFSSLFPAWGPYSKTYMGISHLPALAAPGTALPLPATMDNGARFDCVVHPTLHSSFQPMPNTTTASTCHPFVDMSGDLTRVHYRYELGEGPGQRAYADVRFAPLDTDSVLLRTEFVNNTERMLDCVLNYFLTMDMPRERVARAQLKQGVLMVAGQDHQGVHFATPRPWDGQQPDATRAGVLRDGAFVDGYGFGDRVSCEHVPHLGLQPWGAQPGDSVTFDLPLPADVLRQRGYHLALRYRTVPRRETGGPSGFARHAMGIFSVEAAQEDAAPALLLSGAAEGQFQLENTPELSLLVLDMADKNLAWQDGRQLVLRSNQIQCGLEIDCLLLGTREALAQCTFDAQALLPAPVSVQAVARGVQVDYPAQGARYVLSPYGAATRLRMLHSGCLEDAEPMRVSNPHFTFDELDSPFSGSFPRKRSKPGTWVNIVTGDILVPPQGRALRYAVLTFDRERDAAAALPPADWQQHVFGRPGLPLDDVQKQQFNLAFPATALLPAAPKDIRQGMGILRATLLQNVVYPIYTKQGWIAHFTPGKRWDNLYTWDGGFIALGLKTVNRQLSEYMLDLYLAPLDDPEQAFVHHGSPVPVQWMALRELVSDAPPQEQLRLLKRYYERAKLFYLFIVGRTHGSTTDKFQSGLLSTYDYFYSAHGMDDYPAQLRTHLQGLSGNVAPAITASQAILGARTLTLLSHLFERLDAAQADALQADRRMYAADIQKLSQALEQHAWDADSQYYGYVVHDEHGAPQGILRDENGCNLNCGFDGAYPLVGLGAQAPHRRELLNKLTDERELLTPYGLTAVSQSAPYFSHAGYWNGSVWYPHAWYFGRTLLDLAQGDFLLTLVNRQLSAWCVQANARWNSYEMLRLASGEGAWHPTFSGLTSPLLNWAHSLYTPGTLTTGLSALVLSRERTARGGTSVLLCHQGQSDGFHLWLADPDARYTRCTAWRLNGTPDMQDIQLIFSSDDQLPDAPSHAQPLPSTLAHLQHGLWQVHVRL